MASQVLSGTGNVSYTNNTGQNVRVVINFMSTSPSGSVASATMSMSWGSGQVFAGVGGYNVLAIGRNLAFSSGVYSTTSSSGHALAISSNNMVMNDQSSSPYAPSELTNVAMPTELMLAPGHIFSANCASYNIVVIPEAG